MPNVARLIDMFCMHCRFRKSPEPFRREPMAGRLITRHFAAVGMPADACRRNPDNRVLYRRVLYRA
jgi:hypothetical protein